MATGLSVCSRADAALIYILTSEMYSTHAYTPLRVIFVPFHLHNAEKRNQTLVVKSQVGYITCIALEWYVHTPVLAYGYKSRICSPLLRLRT